MSVGLTPAIPASTIDRSIEAATDALLGLQRPDGHWVFELEADATIPAEYVLLRHYLAEPVDVRAGNQDRRLSAPHPGRARRLAAVPRRRLRHEREREGLFRAQDDRRRHRCPAHGARARSDPLARRRGARERVHPADAGAFRVHSVARGAGHAGRDHAAAEVVSVPPRQDFVLEPHRHRAAAGAAGAQAEGAQPQGRQHRRALPRAAADDRPGAEGAAAEGLVVLVLSRRRFPAACARAVLSEAVAATRDRARGGMGRRAPQRRGRSRRDLPGDGEQRDDVRRAGLSGGSSATRHRARVDREAAGGARG